MRRMIKFHPAVIAIFFACVVFYTMYSNNPIILIISLVCSLIFYLVLEDGRKFFQYLLFVLLVGSIITITNPLFVSRGETVLFTVWGKIITKESLVYGAAMAMMLLAIITWFKCYNKIMTMDKFIYLFGKPLPSIATTISLGITFIPRFIEKGKAINTAQKNLGLYEQKKLGRIRLNLRVFSSLITWALENSLDTADSMNARGYGLKQKTRFSVFRYKISDLLLTIIMLSLMAFIIVGSALKYLDYKYYPQLTPTSFDLFNILLYIALGCLMLIPTFIEVKENIKWNFFKSKI
ncbi:MAG TPA: energy-coupling factor transporter transmembrane component T [Bacilli bacterium]|nr:energy-coupling factor transporter transmembrane component T [Bacilli bacterium]